MQLHSKCNANALQDYCKVTTLAILMHQSGCKVATPHAYFALPTRQQECETYATSSKLDIDNQMLNANVIQLHSKSNAMYIQRKGKKSI